MEIVMCDTMMVGAVVSDGQIYICSIEMTSRSSVVVCQALIRSHLIRMWMGNEKDFVNECIEKMKGEDYANDSAL